MPKLLLKGWADNVLHDGITKLPEVLIDQMLVGKKQMSPQMLRAGQKIFFLIFDVLISVEIGSY